MRAGTVRISADMAIRTITAAAGLQPARISAEANVPDVPNVAADSIARARPAPPGPDRGARVAFTTAPPDVDERPAPGDGSQPRSNESRPFLLMTCWRPGIGVPATGRSNSPGTPRRAASTARYPTSPGPAPRCRPRRRPAPPPRPGWSSRTPAPG